MNDTWAKQVRSYKIVWAKEQAAAILKNALLGVFPEVGNKPVDPEKLSVIADRLAVIIQADNDASATNMLQDKEFIKLVAVMIEDGVNKATQGECKGWSKAFKVKRLPEMNQSFWQSVNNDVIKSRALLSSISPEAGPRL